MPNDARLPHANPTLPKWWRAWETFAPRWLMAAEGRLRLNPSEFDGLQRQGFETRNLRAWRPSAHDRGRLKNAGNIMARALKEPAGRLGERKLHLGQQLAGTGHWADLRRLAEAYLDGMQRVTPTPKPAPTPPRPESPLKKPVALIRREKKHRKIKRLVDDVSGDRLVNRSSDIARFVNGITEFTLYLDEAWPLKNGEIRRNEGVIAGLLCQGSHEHSQAELPAIETHIFQKPAQAQQALERLWACRHCLPLFFPLRMPREDQHAGGYYDQLLQHAMRFLCGWLLPPSPQMRRLSVFAEAIGQHHAGSEATEFYRGLFAGDPNERFANWHLVTVAWREKNFGYIPYADLVAHLTHQHTDLNRALGAWSGFKELPGYVPFSLELVPRLERLQHLDRSENLGDVIDFALETGASPFGRLVMADIARQLTSQPQLQIALLERLEEDYRAKVLDLRRLRRAFTAVRSLLPALPEGASPQMRLLWYQLALQDANHDGDPTRSYALATEYRRERERLKDNARELCADADLNLAVHDADRFAFGHAELTVLEWIEDPLFAALPPRQQARLYSALGQYRALRGHALEAEASFGEALERFRRAELSEDDRQAEIEQTSIYRAINALDANLPEASRALAAVFGQIDAALSDALARDGSLTSQYRHHLLVRALVLRPELAEARAAYLAARAAWSDGYPQHPWPGIHGYRGFLLWNQEQLDEATATAARDAFTRAIEVSALACHGPTLKLIGAFWATVAACCLEHCGYEERGHALLDQARVLPDAAPIIETLKTVLRAPDPTRLSEVFSALPFNYR